MGFDVVSIGSINISELKFSMEILLHMKWRESRIREVLNLRDEYYKVCCHRIKVPSS